ncbi:hypothetical protein F5148DRAFT_466259 [Russula earlei]|uniref:Uncharacterized protein n=1 Tax=Russula earlei TaxID=71964 RepID=A0ACC0UPR1_9AGAM|nr:hypothetical protein F5148DRAFT_466259 [Russula earlei]
MAFDRYLRRGYFVFFAVLVVIAAIELAISAWLTSRYHEHHNYLSTTERDRVHFLLFCSIWSTILSPILPTLLLLESAIFLTGIAANVIFLFLSWLFWLSGAAAITESLGGGLNCNFGYVYCGQLNALEAFAWIEWVLLTLGFTIVLVLALRAIQRGEGYNGRLFL